MCTLYRLSQNTSTAGNLCKSWFSCLGNLANNPFFITFTLENGTYSNVLICCLVARMGTLSENACSKRTDLILPLKTLRTNIISCCTSLAETDVSSKCFSKSAYEMEDERRWQFAFSHIKNLCSIRPILSRCTAAAPLQITLLYSMLDRT